jgi:hypothetical protein
MTIDETFGECVRWFQPDAPFEVCIMLNSGQTLNLHVDMQTYKVLSVIQMPDGYLTDMAVQYPKNFDSAEDKAAYWQSVNRAKSFKTVVFDAYMRDSANQKRRVRMSLRTTQITAIIVMGSQVI